MAGPKVSVLLPVRDAERTVEAAISSLRSQTFDALEIIAVDDGSRDGTWRALERARSGDRRIELIKQQPTGIVAALRRAAAAARAPLLARMDADDLCEPERLRAQVAWLERRPELALVGCLVESFGERPPTDGWRRYEAWLNSRRTAEQIARDLWIESPIAHPSVLMRRDAYEASGGYRELDGPEDYDLWLRLAARGWSFAKVPRVLLRWRDHPRRLTRTDPRYRPDAFLELKVTHLLEGPLLERERPLLLWGAGRYGGRLGRSLIARGVEIAAFIDIDPRRIGNTRHGRPVVDPRDLGRFERPLVLAAVAVPEARPLIRARLTRRGLVELEDYWVCA